FVMSVYFVLLLFFSFFFFFFFFQAEDGIRDFHVTGVQTCALPICHGLGVERQARRREHVFVNRLGKVGIEQPTPDLAHERRVTRSEERRVGKECRSRTAPYAQKKKRSERRNRRV